MKKILLSSKSNFKIIFNNKFKIKDYKLESKINIEDLNLIYQKKILKNIYQILIIK